MQNDTTMIVQLTVAQLQQLIGAAVASEFQKHNSIMKIDAKTKSNELLTRAEVSNLLKVSFPTLWSWNKSGILTSKKIGNKVFYEKADVMAQLRKK